MSVGLPHELAHHVIPGWGQLVTAELLSLIRHVWMSQMNSSAPLGQARSS